MADLIKQNRRLGLPPKSEERKYMLLMVELQTLEHLDPRRAEIVSNLALVMPPNLIATC